MQEYDETLAHLVLPIGEDRSPEKLINRHGTGDGQIDTYQYEGLSTEMYRVVQWHGTLIISAIVYVRSANHILIHRAYTRPEYRRKHYAQNLYLHIVEEKTIAPGIYTTSGQKFWEAVNKIKW